jgi:hypothetical protein
MAASAMSFDFAAQARSSARMQKLSLILLTLCACGGDATTGSASGSAKPAASGSAAAKATASAAPSAAATATATVVAPPSDVPSGAASANVTMENAELDGFKMKAISCKAANANPLTAIALLKPLAAQKAALDGCVDKPSEVSVHFNVVDKKATEVKVAGAPTPEAAACIAKAIEGAAWADPLTCVVKVDLKAAGK